MKKFLFAAFCAAVVGTSANAQNITDTSFNPALSVVLEGGFVDTKSDPEEYSIPGFDVGAPEGRIEGEGFYTGHNEITASANVDDLFYGQATVVVAEHDGEAEVELEEAFIQTLGLGHGLSVRAGRMLPVFGYLNEKHLHQDYFVERPLIYQGMLGGHMIDDGIEASIVLPTDLYAEIGAGLFAGNSYPSTKDKGIGTYTGFARVGGDFNESISWRAGLHYLFADPNGREAGSHDHGGTVADLEFTGDTSLYGLEFKLEWAPEGNSVDQKVEFRTEYFIKKDDGFYDDGTDTPLHDGTAEGFYTQLSYKFSKEWSAGVRYEQLMPEDNIDADLIGTALDSEGHNPESFSLQLQYAPSEFSRVRVGYTNAELHEEDPVDHRFMVNFQVSLGAHGAHKY